jgi:hypothetical protein
MSLIIDMLKDLDKRHQHAPLTPPLMNDYRQYSLPSFESLKKPLLVMLIIIFLFALTYFFTHQKQNRLSLVLPAPVSVANTGVTTPATEDQTINPVIINGVSFETKNDTTEVTFLLNHDSLYRIVSNDKNNIITLYIDNATMQSDLPTLIGADVSIQNIISTATNGNLKFALTLKPGAFLKSVDLTTDTKAPELVVVIGNPQLPPDEIIKTTGSIKSPALQSIVVDQYQAAIKLSELGKKQEAIVSLTKLLDYYPDYNDARVALAAVTLETGNPIQARKIIDDGLSIAPDYLPLIELKARLLTSEGKTSEALMVLQSEQPLITEAPGYHALLAALYSRENKHKLSVSIYQQLVQLNPHEGSWWFGLAVSQDKLGNNQDAIFAYTKAATEGHLNPQAVAFLHQRLQILQGATNA